MDNNNMYNQEPQNMQTQQPYQQVYQNENLEEPVTFGDWMLSLLLMMIPCVNIVMMFVYAFGNGKKSKSNFFKAYLVWMLISIVLSVIIIAIFGASMAAMMATMGY
ncbi:MAG: hypothetical protein IJO85_07135 [Lachnospiraceae bacterium]|nr:hypothetical protein [Lachnospiraceae bacterium]MBQ6887071.1 hypothetical protein [Lachnospiraceae bacterium]